MFDVRYILVIVIDLLLLLKYTIICICNLLFKLINVLQCYGQIFGFRIQV